MRVVITHTDFRIYWPERLKSLQAALEQQGDELFVIEIAGEGSNYAFAGKSEGADTERHWICLFPRERMEEILPRTAARKLYSKLQELQPDVVMGGAIAYTSGAIAVRWAKQNHKAVIIFDTTRRKDVPRNRIINAIKQVIYHQVDAILCPSPYWNETFLGWQFKKEQLFYGLQVVDNAFWEKRSVPPPTLPPKYFLNIGRLIPVKNQLFLLKAYKQYQQSKPLESFPLVIVGEGPMKDLLKKTIDDEAIRDVYLLPFLSQHELRSLYQHAVAFVLPSTSETWGLVINEAMASSLPVLVSNECGCALTLINEGVNGNAFSPYDQQELCDLLCSFSNKSISAIKKMGMASHEIIQQWGHDRFTNGAIQAINYVVAGKIKAGSLIGKFILKYWNGRYRPI